MAKKKLSRKRTAKSKVTPKRNSNEPVFRVWRFDTFLKEAIAEKRNSRGQTVKEFVENSVSDELSGLVDALAKQGVSVEDAESMSPMRIPIEEPTLASLRYASQASGLDQSQLLTACLRLATRRKRRRFAN